MPRPVRLPLADRHPMSIVTCVNNTVRVFDIEGRKRADIVCAYMQYNDPFAFVMPYIDPDEINFEDYDQLYAEHVESFVDKTLV